MRYAIACDHAGFPLKEATCKELERLGHDVVDLGGYDTTPSDYPDAARRIGEAVASGQAERGVLLCGSGVGASIAANKIVGVRAAVCHDTYSSAQGVEHDDMNILCLGARVVAKELAVACVRAFASATFSGAERHVRRLNKVLELEREYSRGKD